MGPTRGAETLSIRMMPPGSGDAIAGRLETLACPLCCDGSSSVAYDFDPFRVVRCQGCGLYYLSPCLTRETMQGVYRSDRYFEQGSDEGTAGYSSYAAQERSLRATFSRLCGNLAERGLAGGRLLDVGCGYGYLLDEARPYFDRRVGTDFSANAAARARTYADAVYVGGLDDLPPAARFDCIAAVNVLEHTHDPVAFVRRLAGAGATGAAVIIAVPNMASLIRRLLGRRWPSFKIPEHTLYFDQRTLRLAMRLAGLQNIEGFPFSHAFPLALIAGHLGVGIPRALGRIIVWVPTTMTAAYGFVP